MKKFMDLAAPGMTSSEKDKLADLIRSSRDVFVLTDSELG